MCGYPFQSMTRRQAKDAFGTAAFVDKRLWQEFEYIELITNQRQKEDLQYAQLLNRLRVGEFQAGDAQSLRERVIVPANSSDEDKLNTVAAKFTELRSAGKAPMCLFSRNADADRFNQFMLQFSNVQSPMEIDAIDSDRKSKKPRKVAKGRESAKASDRAGLETTLHIGVGARVMLRRNIDGTAGLVNGALGSVESIAMDTDTNTAIKINIQFDRLGDEPISIERVEVDFDLGRKLFITRKQFPLILAYGLTIHKCQGLSLDSAIIDLGYSTFECAQAYVALSRVRSLDGVFLIEFVAGKVQSAPLVLVEYNRLRAKALNHDTLLPLSLQPPRIDAPLVSMSLNPNKDWALKIQIEQFNQKTVKSKTRGKIKTPATLTVNEPNERRAAVTRQIFQQPLSQSEMRLRNPSATIANACFANAVVQAGFFGYGPVFWEHVSHLNQVIPAELVGDSPIHTVHSALLKLRQNKIEGAHFDSVHHLRMALARATQDHVFDNGTQQDAAEMYDQVIAHLPGVINQLSVQELSQRQCSVCGTIVPLTDQPATVVRFEVNGEPTKFAGAVQLLTAPEEMDTAVCPSCQYAHPSEQTRQYAVPAACTNIMMQAGCFGLDQFQKGKVRQQRKVLFKFKDFPQQLTFGHAQTNPDQAVVWRPTGIVCHSGQSVNSGHYWALRRVDQGWLLFNDDRPPKFLPSINDWKDTNINDNVGCGYLFFLEKEM